MDNSHLKSIIETLNPPPNFKPWHRGPTLMGSLRGIDAVQAAWKPAPNRHSIWERALHIAYWNYSVRRYFESETKHRFPRSPSNFPEVSDTSEEAWKEDKRLISDGHDKLVLAIRSFPKDRFSEKSASEKEWTYSQLLAGVTVHDAYHIGQIQLMKRLYRSLVENDEK